MSKAWPELNTDKLKDTHDLVAMMFQIVGKYKLANTSWINHAWHATLYLNATGFTTSPIPDKESFFEVRFNFIKHQLEIHNSDGQLKVIKLMSMSVSNFWQQFRKALEDLGANLDFHNRPNEVPDPVSFEKQTSVLEYDTETAHNYWLALLNISNVFQKFRTGFLGKVSPVHFFWGSSDLAVTRFSGKEAPLHPGGVPSLPNDIAQEAYSHEVSSAGFWAGAGLGYPAFYSYSYPSPEGFGKSSVLPEEAFYSKELGEFVLAYEVVQKAKDPDQTLLNFLKTTYEAAANLGGWDRKSLDCDMGGIREVRKLKRT